MATVEGMLEVPADEASGAVRRAAAALGYSLAEGESSPDRLVFRKGASLFSWGSALTVDVVSPSTVSTKLVIATKETWAITDWGRGERAAQRLLAAAGAKS